MAGLSLAERWLGAQELAQTYSRKQADLGPRALGLVQLSSTGKARLIPIVIMMDGKFYDAGSYKATPVPMALDFGIVYEGFKTGVSQGTFTITQPGQLNHNWIAEGTWLPAGVKGPETKKKYVPPVIDTDSKDDRPVLHRRPEGAADKDEAKPAASSTPAPSTTTPSGNAPASTPTASSPAGSPPASTPNSSTGNSPPTNTKDDRSDATKPAAAATSTKAPADEPITDPNRPRLRRGKPDPNAHHEPFVDFDAEESVAKSAGTAAGTGTNAAASKDAVATVQSVTAISDAAGPDPRPYTYDLKPAEEAIYRNKMLDMAAKLIKLKSGQGASLPSSPSATTKAGSPAHTKQPAAQPKPQFENLNLHIFDLSSSNEPVLVLSARTHVPAVGASGAQLPQEITLIARTNLEGELHKLFFGQTDSRHLDASPRMELIDAVDVDGDGRGELLFRKTTDAGSAYAIYRVTADQLWPLYEGTP